MFVVMIAASARMATVQCRDRFGGTGMVLAYLQLQDREDRYPEIARDLVVSG